MMSQGFGLGIDRLIGYPPPLMNESSLLRIPCGADFQEMMDQSLRIHALVK
jgi:hypothetical protein